MQVFGKTIFFRDFVPPLLEKVWNKFYVYPGRHHPFEYLPNWVEPSWFLDVGANIGDVTKNALRTFPQCRAICFEPVSSTFKQLKDNLSSFNGRVIYFQKALSNENRKCHISITSFHGANSIEQQSRFHRMYNPSVYEIDKEEIEICRLDDVAKDFPTRKIDIIKIDVEGHELNVLKGGCNLISQSVDVVIIEISLQRDTSFEEQRYVDLFFEMKNLGFALINAYDVHNSKFAPKSEKQTIMLTQLDCVFAHIEKLRNL